MVKCMAAVYCWLQSASLIDTGKSPLLFRSSTNVCNLKAALQMSLISTEKWKFSPMSLAINNYRILVEQLKKVNLGRMEESLLTAFWINVYNALVMHAYGIPSSSLRRLALFHKSGLRTTSAATLSARPLSSNLFSALELLGRDGGLKYSCLPR